VLLNKIRDFLIEHRIKETILDNITDSYGGLHKDINGKNFRISFLANFFEDYEINLKKAYFEGKTEVLNNAYPAQLHQKTGAIYISGKIKKDFKIETEKYEILFPFLRKEDSDKIFINYFIIECEYKQYLKFLKKRKILKIKLCHLDLGKKIIDSYRDLSNSPINT
jgi:hypothetical protein